MNYLPIFFLLIITTLSIFGCQKSNKSSTQIDNKSYINDFELLQENPNKETSVKITSPKAIIDSTNNDIDIFDSSIELLNKNGLIVLEFGSTTQKDAIIDIFNGYKHEIFNDYTHHPRVIILQ